jgi:hypothetical protein
MWWDTSVATALAFAGFLCILYAFVSLGLERWRRAPAAGGARERLGFLAVAVLLFAFAATTQLVGDKVATPSSQAAASSGQSTTSSSGAATADSDYFASHLSSFRPGPVLESERLRNELCLVRYYSSRPGQDPGANWWTTCKLNSTFKSVADVRKELALPVDWGKRNARVIARIPAGESVVFMRGPAARQCEPSGKPCYAGGGDQLLFRSEDFDRSWFVRYECSTAPEKAAIRFTACAG